MDTANISYDDEITVFSPDGRLFQVEYAREAIKKGSIILGIIYNEGVVLMAKKFFISVVAENPVIQKIFKIDDHIGCAITGLSADGYHLVDVCHNISQYNKILYDDNIPLKVLVKEICEYKHVFTQFAGVRPFGTALLIAGVDETGARLFSTDPSGAFLGYKATCIGQGCEIANSYLTQKYRNNLSYEDSIDMGLKTLKKLSKKKLDAKIIEIAVIDYNNKFYYLSEKDIIKLIK